MAAQPAPKPKRLMITLCAKRQAILDTRGHMLVKGGPGSGKTTIALLKARAFIDAIKPGQEILFLSFSRAAVRQVLSRCKELLKARERAVLCVKTYHAFCVEVLQSHGRLLTGRKARFLPPDEERLAKSEFDGDWNAEVRRRGMSDGVFAFDLFAPAVAELFTRSRAVRKLYANKYPMIVADEFQDSDDDQWRIIRALASDASIFALADPEQRIFDYRPNVSPKRLEELRAELSPAEFDLATENHRSPGSGILDFADAVLQNRPLPETKDVTQVSYVGKAFATVVHAGVVWTFSQLRKRGVRDPSVAVLCKTNALVAQVSSFLTEEHTYKENPLRPIPHDVLWDAELVAASARVVASILEWHAAPEMKTAVARTLDLIAHYYRLKNAGKPSDAAATERRKMRDAADAVRGGTRPANRAGIALLNFFPSMSFSGDVVEDWRTARQVLANISSLSELFREARLVRLFRATDAIGERLGALWLSEGTYRGASDLVKRVLDEQRMIGAERDHRGCTLMNIHKSKGKEFDGVVLIEGPYSGAFFANEREDPPHVKTRRLLRVAITRARTFVTIIRPKDAARLSS